jgi:hypothetical protein
MTYLKIYSEEKIAWCLTIVYLPCHQLAKFEQNRMEIGTRLREGKVIRIEVADCVEVTRNSSALVWCGGCQKQDNLKG